MSILSNVEDQMALIKAYATSANSTAVDAINSLATMDFPTPQAANVTYDSMGYVIPNSATPPSSIATTTPPSLVTLILPDKVTKPDIPAVSLGSLLSIVLPDVPAINFPSLNIDPPVYSITQPSQYSFSISDILISDDPMIKAAIDRLTSNIANGGTGLSQAVEIAIFDRDLERNEQQLADSTDKVMSMWAKKGFSLPDGLLANSLSDLQKEYMNKRLDRSREIAIKQAELEQANLFKSLELCISLAGDLIKMLISYEELVLRSQEDTAKFANEYIDIQIRTYAAKVEAYRATAQVHEVMVRAEMAKVELYKAQIEGQQAILQVNEQTVKIYSEQLRATVILIDRYKTEVEAMKADLDSEKLKLEANKLQMDSWAVQAKTKIDTFIGNVELFKATVQQNVSVADIMAKELESSVRINLQAVELALKEFEVGEKSVQYIAGLRVEAAKQVALTAASMASGALAAMSARADMSYTESHPYDSAPAV